jgi:hypothetical protein
MPKPAQPIGITFISRPFEEDKLLKIGYAFEQGTKASYLKITSKTVSMQSILQKNQYFFENNFGKIFIYLYNNKSV